MVEVSLESFAFGVCVNERALVSDPNEVGLKLIKLTDIYLAGRAILRLSQILFTLLNLLKLFRDHFRFENFPVAVDILSLNVLFGRIRRAVFLRTLIFRPSLLGLLLVLFHLLVSRVYNL